MSTEKLLDGKNIIITGTSQGMGKSMVRLFAEQGANIWAHARTASEEHVAYCEQISAEYGVRVDPWCFDLTDYEAMKSAVKELRSEKLPVDVLVNCAGVTYNALFQMSQMDEVRNQFEVNFFAVYQLTQYIVKLMIRNKKGSIVNITSTAGQDGNSGKSAYGASKAALIAMTQSIAEELGGAGIRANCIAPGVTNTRMLATMPDYVVAEEVSGNALQRLGEPEDIARTALFLASDLSSYITGQTIRVDGGMTNMK